MMPVLTDMLAESVDIAALVVLLIMCPFFVLFTVRVATGHTMPTRSIAAYQRIRELVSQAAETGMGIHVALGRGQVGGITTPDSVAGLYVLDYVAQHATQYGQSIASMAGDSATYALAQGVSSDMRDQAVIATGDARRGAGFSGPDPMAYAAGSGRQAAQEPLLAQVVVGAYGQEAAWVAQEPQQPQAIGLGGTGDLPASALLVASLDEAVVGEDVYAAGAYLGRRLHLGSLVAQDLIRVVIILSIVVGVALTSLGYWG